MKKRYLLTGLIFLLLGLIGGICMIHFDVRFQFVSTCLFISGLNGGSFLLWKYCYWSRKKNRVRSRQFLEQEQIERKDERKEKLRNMAAKYTYIAGLFIIFISIVIFSVLRDSGINLNIDIIICYLTGYFFLQYFTGIIVFNYLNKKY